MSADPPVIVPPAIPPLPSQKKGLPKGCTIALIAGLVAVIGLIVIALVASLVMAAVGRVRAKAFEAQAKATMANIELAIGAYQREYGNRILAAMPPPPVDAEALDSSEDGGRALLSILNGNDSKSNPRQIRFWEPLQLSSKAPDYTPSIGLIDVWGKNGYRILLDDNGDGHIADPENLVGDISAGALIYSAGPDGDFATWKDNVCSWR